jgi:hypothetical protein
MQSPWLYMDVRDLPQDIQQQAYERGLIPFLPPPH